MVVESFRSCGEGGCEIALREVVDGAQVTWRFVLDAPAQLVLAFLNDDYSALRTVDAQGSEVHMPDGGARSAFFRETFTRGNGQLLKDMVDHVLVCESERGFDPIVRLAAYSFTNEMFDLSRVASYAERVSLETSVLGSAPAQAMAERWNALLEDYKRRELPRREELFEALVRDAARKNYPFELGVSREYSSLPQMLRAFVSGMVRRRELLRKCGACGRYGLAAEEGCCEGSGIRDQEAGVV